MNLTGIPMPFREQFEQSPKVLGGKLRLHGSRVSVEQVLELLEAGEASSDIVRSFPSIEVSSVNAVKRLAAHCALTLL